MYAVQYLHVLLSKMLEQQIVATEDVDNDILSLLGKAIVQGPAGYTEGVKKKSVCLQPVINKGC
jgi:hypothetical protein